MNMLIHYNGPKSITQTMYPKFMTIDQTNYALEDANSPNRSKTPD